MSDLADEAESVSVDNNSTADDIAACTEKVNSRMHIIAKDLYDKSPQADETTETQNIAPDDDIIDAEFDEVG